VSAGKDSYKSFFFAGTRKTNKVLKTQSSAMDATLRKAIAEANDPNEVEFQLDPDNAKSGTLGHKVRLLKPERQNHGSGGVSSLRRWCETPPSRRHCP